MDLKVALEGVKEFFEDEWYDIDSVVPATAVTGQRQEEECRPHFDHCFVDQGGGGFSGDDFHGTVFFYIGDNEYLSVQY